MDLDKHANSRDLKRQKNKKMSVNGRSVFTMMRADQDRTDRINYRREQKIFRAMEQEREIY